MIYISFLQLKRDAEKEYLPDTVSVKRRKLDSGKSASETSDKIDSVSSDGGDSKIGDLADGELTVGNNMDNVSELTLDGNISDGGDLSVIDNMENFASCNSYVGGDNIAVNDGHDLNDEKPSGQVCNKCASLKKTSKNLKRCVNRLQKKVKDLKAKNKELVIILCYV